ncbi:MAG: DUF3887 domain-containing protein [Desulfomonile tiedjei]|nr:DUF3887 domain-containing protein [Desulfomonile tiedjei]
MFRNVKFLFLPVLALTFFLSGPVTAAEMSGDTEQVKDRATAVLEGMMRAIAEGDYAQYTRDFSKQMKDSQNRESFLQLQSNLQRGLGKFKSMEYLGFYIQYGGTVTLFKARFGKEKEDVLIRLVLDRKKSPPQVTGFWFDSPSLEK